MKIHSIIAIILIMLSSCSEDSDPQSTLTEEPNEVKEQLMKTSNYVTAAFIDLAQSLQVNVVKYGFTETTFTIDSSTFKFNPIGTQPSETFISSNKYPYTVEFDNGKDMIVIDGDYEEVVIIENLTESEFKGTIEDWRNLKRSFIFYELINAPDYQTMAELDADRPVTFFESCSLADTGISTSDLIGKTYTNYFYENNVLNSLSYTFKANGELVIYERVFNSLDCRNKEVESESISTETYSLGPFNVDRENPNDSFELDCMNRSFFVDNSGLIFYSEEEIADFQIDICIYI